MTARTRRGDRGDAPAWTRRRLLIAAGAAALVACRPPAHRGSAATAGSDRHAAAGGEPRALRVGWLTPPGGASPGAEAGLELGVEEASHAARLLGRGGVELVRGGEGGSEALVEAADVVLGWMPAVDLAATAASGLPALSLLPAATAEPSAVVLQIAWPEPWRRQALARAPDGGAGHHVAEWHPSLVRYGAAQLNERFARRFGSGAREDGWRAWAAVKAAAEAWLRRGDRDLASSLRALSFDGHKGAPLSFGAGGILRHPAYLVSGSGDRETVVDTVSPPDRAPG